MAFAKAMMKRSGATATVSAVLLGLVVISVLSWSAPAAFIEALSQLVASAMLAILLCLAGGVLLAALRLKLISADLGYRLSLRDAAMTLSVGQLAGNLFFQFAGQMISRAAYLASRGIPPAASFVISGYERVFALCTSIALAIAGAIYLFGRLTIDLNAGGLSLVKLALGFAAVVSCGAAIAWGPRAWAVVSRLTLADGLHILRGAAISLAIQLCTLAAYVVAGRALAPQIDFFALAAASSLIMFAASLPISFGGWGMREMSAVVALQAVGLSSASALLIGLLIGAMSIAVVAATAAMLLLPVIRQVPSCAAAAQRPAVDWTVALDWVVPVAAASAIFFQIYLPTGTGRLNVNLADPLALVGAALFGLHVLAKGWPTWRVPRFHRHLAALTLVIVIAFLNGLATTGWTEWATTNRLLGWGMLLCYVATGALIARHAPDQAVRLVLATFVASASAVAALDVGIYALVQAGVSPLLGMVDPRLTGFSQNPNAFSFILLLALAAALTLESQLRAHIALMAAIFLGLLFGASRAAYVALPFVVGMAALCGIRLRPVATAFCCAGVAALTIATLPYLHAFVCFLFGWENGAGQVAYSLGTSESDLEHLTTVRDGLVMFFAHPIFGAGLGAFMAEQIRAVGTPLVIHSTPVWLLAETGIAGFATFAFVGWRICRCGYLQRGEVTGRLIVLALTAFAVMGQAHDLLYQRALWLLIGMAIAVPLCRRNPRAAAC